MVIRFSTLFGPLLGQRTGLFLRRLTSTFNSYLLTLVQLHVSRFSIFELRVEDGGYVASKQMHHDEKSAI